MSQMDYYRDAIAVIDADFPGQSAQLLADFIDQHIPHSADGDEYEQRVHDVMVNLCKILDRSGLPRPFNMQVRG